MLMTTEPVKCPNCGALIGEAVDIGKALGIDGLFLLRVGGILLQQSEGKCMNCGRNFYWEVSKKVLNRLIRELSQDEGVGGVKSSELLD